MITTKYSSIVTNEVHPRRNNDWNFIFDNSKYDELHHPHNAVPTKEQLETVDGLSIPSVAYEPDVLDSLPKCLHQDPSMLMKMPKLKWLSLPIELLEGIQLPDTIISLVLIANLKTGSKFGWPKYLSLPNLKFIYIPSLLKTFDIELTQFHKLEGIKINLSKETTNKKIRSLGTIDSLKFADISYAKSLDIFTPLSHLNIRHMGIVTCIGKKFPIENLRLMKNLESIWINYIAVELDCNIFLSLPKLLEINIYNTAKLTNVTALLKHPSLKIIHVVGCEKPFEDIDTAPFYKKNYEHFDIEYA